MNKLIESNAPNGTIVVESQEAATGSVVCGDLASLPDTVEVQFGVKFDVRIGAVIAHGRTEGNLHIKLVWKPS